MSWMRLESNFRGHPKVTALARKLGVARVTARGHLVTLWTWTMEYAPDGCLEAFSDEVIEESAEWEGAPGVFVAALKETKLLDVAEVGAEIHDWMDYAGSYKEAKRKADERAQRSKPTPVQTEVADSAGLSRTIPPRARADVRTYVQDERTESAEREADASSPPPSVSGASVAPQSSDDRTSKTIASHLEVPPLEQDYASPEHESGDPRAQNNGKTFALQPAAAKTKTKTSKKKASRKKEVPAEDVEAVIDRYRTLYPRTHPGPKERTKIRERLLDGFSVAELFEAIEGNSVRPFNVDGGYHKLSLIMRDGDQIELYRKALKDSKHATNGARTIVHRDIKPQNIPPGAVSQTAHLPLRGRP